MVISAWLAGEVENDVTLTSPILYGLFTAEIRGVVLVAVTWRLAPLGDQTSMGMFWVELKNRSFIGGV